MFGIRGYGSILQALAHVKRLNIDLDGCRLEITREGDDVSIQAQLPMATLTAAVEHLASANDGDDNRGE